MKHVCSEYCAIPGPSRIIERVGMHATVNIPTRSKIPECLRQTGRRGRGGQTSLEVRLATMHALNVGHLRLRQMSGTWGMSCHGRDRWQIRQLKREREQGKTESSPRVLIIGQEQLS